MRDVLEQLPIDFLQRHRLLPLGENEGRVRIGMCSRDSLAGLEDVRLLLERDVEPVFMSSEEVDEGLRGLLVSKLDSQAGDDEAVVIADEAQDLMRAGSDAPVVQLVNTILLKAMGMNASDVHIEPYEEVGVVRFRVDGVLQEGLQIPKGRLAAVIARIKVMSRLNLAESRLPQDGRIKVKAGDHLIDLRVSTLPTLFGERTVMRLLRSGQLLSLPEIGLWQDDFQNLKRLSDYSYGMILATGPTGSGKSTTLYGMMLMIQSAERNMISIEDPVEYQVARIGQIQVNARIGLTFAAGLRSILRQDPDVIMVGEIRDSETAEIAVHAALTGHLMLSTLHTNDAPTAVSRLMDMGVEGYLLSSSLLGVMAQRLVRKLCVACRRAARPTPEELYSLGVQEVAPNALIHHPVGCAQCNGTGYKGRSGVFEIMVLNDELRRLIVRSGDAASLRQAARASGMRTLLEDGARKVLNGQTSIHEVLPRHPSLMPLYEYRAYDAAGRLLKGLIDAPSERLAHDKVKARGLFPSTLTEDTGEGGSGRGAPGETLAFTMIQVATLLRAGMPLPAALESVSTQVTVPALQRALVRTRVRLSEGKNLAEAMADEAVFPPLLIRLVEAGNTVGELENILERFADFTERQEEFRKKLIGALTYPLVVLTASCALIIFMLTYIAPVITGIYAGLGKDLPTPTLFMMAVADFFRDNLAFLLVALSLALVGWWRIVPRRIKDTLSLRLPFFGTLLTLSAAARWCRTLAMLHAGGVPLQRALKGAREVLDNTVLISDMQVVEQQVELGSGLAPALRRVWRMPPLVSQMAETGERSGALESLMNSAAIFYEKDVDRRIAQFFRLMEPAMILGLGIVVGFVVISIMLPIIDLNSAIS